MSLPPDSPENHGSNSLSLDIYKNMCNAATQPRHSQDSRWLFLTESAPPSDNESPYQSQSFGNCWPIDPVFLRNSLSDFFNEVAVVRSELERRVCSISFFKDATLKYIGVYWPKVGVFFAWGFDDQDLQQKWEMILMIKLVLMMVTTMMTMQRWHTCWWR